MDIHGAPPLVVDLDGTLIHTDLLVESALALLHKNPLYIFKFFPWLLRGKAQLKHEIARRVDFNAQLLPYNDPLIEWLREQARHRRMVLSTASDLQLAQAVADHLGFFSEVIASNGDANNSGRRKAETLVARFGEKGFDYVGNDHVDLDVWKHAHAATVVSHSASLARKAALLCPTTQDFHPAKRTLRAWVKALRLHQWVKNVLVFVPALAAHLLFTPAALSSAYAFVCFGICASSVYLLNDLLDLPSDRRHHSKRKRPFAAGTLPAIHGALLMPVALMLAFVLAIPLGGYFALVLAGYYLLTLAYSFYFKQKVMADVIVLAGLYTTRLLAGSAAIGIAPSFWLLAFSMFAFLSLAMLKRYTELQAMRMKGRIGARGRGYHVDDLPLVQSLGGASGYIAVLVLALYIDSTQSQSLYRHPHLLWAICPIMLYWISRAWVIAHRGIMHDDPVVFAIKDRTSQMLMIIAAAAMFLAA